MRLYYETATATLIQFVAMSLLSAANNVASVVEVCTGEMGGCLSNGIASLGFFLLTAIWFGIIWVIGFAAQDRRSRILCYALITAELMVLAVANFNLRNPGNLLATVTSALDAVLAVWIIILAFRLSRAKGGRVLRTQRARRRSINRHLKDTDTTL